MVIGILFDGPRLNNQKRMLTLIRNDIVYLHNIIQLVGNLAWTEMRNENKKIPLNFNFGSNCPPYINVQESVVHYIKFTVLPIIYRCYVLIWVQTRRDLFMKKKSGVQLKRSMATVLTVVLRNATRRLLVYFILTLWSYLKSYSRT